MYLYTKRVYYKEIRVKRQSIEREKCGILLILSTWRKMEYDRPYTTSHIQKRSRSVSLFVNRFTSPCLIRKYAVGIRFHVNQHVLLYATTCDRACLVWVLYRGRSQSDTDIMWCCKNTFVYGKRPPPSSSMRTYGLRFR